MAWLTLHHLWIQRQLEHRRAAEFSLRDTNFLQTTHNHPRTCGLAYSASPSVSPPTRTSAPTASGSAVGRMAA